MSPFTIVHIAAGSIALGAGTAAFIYRKGGPRHALIGKTFVVAMLVMASTGGVMAAFVPERLSVVGAALTCYLVVSSWATAHHRHGKAGIFEQVGLVAAVGCAAAFFYFGSMALARPGAKLDGMGASAYFLFGSIAVLCAVLDLNVIVRGTLTGIQRLSRHLWRMSFALFFAAASFFLGQQDEFPHSMQGSKLLFIPPLATLLLMIFWLGRLRFIKSFKRAEKAAGSLFESLLRSDRFRGGA